MQILAVKRRGACTAGRANSYCMRVQQPWLLLLSTAGLCMLLVCVQELGEGHYLRASSRWLVRVSDGERIKLACVNWAAHLETMLPEGLNRQPLYRLGLAVKGMGFNCVRLTFATYMFTNATLNKMTVSESFTKANLQHSLRGISIHNPDLLNLRLQAAYAHVVDLLTRTGLLIILDNHVSKPQWCCQSDDGNGFWGDTFFDANTWLEGLSIVASLFKNNTEVVGISLRNELRGPRQNIQDWYNYMSLGATAINEANPNLLTILSGLHFDTDLRFLSKNHLSSLSFQDKLVYEMHWYTSSYGVNFARGNLNKACAIATSSIMKCGGFMATPWSNGSFAAPLFVSEFGVDQRGGNKGNNRYLNCFFAFMASMDLDWAYWPLQGNYYKRNGHEGDEEYYGILNSQWSAPRNVSFLARLQAIQQPWQSGVNVSSRSEYQVLFHPATGLCVQKGRGNKLFLGSCMEDNTQWKYAPQGRLEIVNSYLCVATEGEGQFAKLVPIGTEKNGPWTLASVAKLQFATTINSTHQSLQNFHHETTSYERGGSTLGQIHRITHNDDNFHIDGSSKAYSHRDHEDDKKNAINYDYRSALLENVEANLANANDKDNDGLNHANEEENILKPQPIHHNPSLCLDGSTPPSITTKRCICVQEDEMDCSKNDDPSPQWFVLVSSHTRPSTNSVS